MILRRSLGIPTDISCANDSGLDNATYVASQRNSALKKRGNFQWKMSPGVAVTPCSVYSVLAFLIVIGSWRLWTFRSYRAPEAMSSTGTMKLPRDSCGSTAMHPARKSQQVQSRWAPATACRAHGTGGKNSVLTSSKNSSRTRMMRWRLKSTSFSISVQVVTSRCFQNGPGCVLG